MEREICYECDSDKVIKSKDYTSVVIKGERIEYEEEFFLCEECGSSYYDDSMIRKNLLTPQDIYRTKHGLLTSEEIKNIRKFYDLSQENLALILNWGAKTITRYESKSIQDSSHNDVLWQVKSNPAFLLEKLRENKEKMNSDYQSIYDNIELVVKNHIEAYSGIQSLLNEYAVFSDRSEYNGNKKIDINIIKKIVCYIIQESEVNKVKLMKMLWYSDMLYYKDKSIGLTGLVYMHYKMGALPKGHNDLLRACSDVVNVEEVYYEFNPDHVSYKISTKGEDNKCDLDHDVKLIVDSVIEKFGDMNTNEIVDYMHKEKAYKETRDKDLISYKYAEFINF